ncbi:MAG: YihY/virulence factor BrkB family protein [Bryobacteraceae bacterium]|nr:YihY/virulence factor BrkB family protein [Bryobacteraceae bacterium]
MKRFLHACRPTFRYWMETEVHVYGFSIGANVLLSFFPFLLVMVSLCRYVFHWQAAENAIYLAFDELFPGALPDILERNLKYWVSRRGFSWISVFLLFFTANGVFEPLEVALNKVWGVRQNRSFLRNQIVSLGLIFICGTLVLISLLFTAANQAFLAQLFGERWGGISFLTTALFKMAALPVTILSLFLIYWLLPNTRIAPARVIPVSIIVGLMIEVLKYVPITFWKWIDAKLYPEYGPFEHSVLIVLWSFLASMLVLGGAEWVARRGIEVKKDPDPPPRVPGTFSGDDTIAPLIAPSID